MFTATIHSDTLTVYRGDHPVLSVGLDETGSDAFDQPVMTYRAAIGQGVPLSVFMTDPPRLIIGEGRVLFLRNAVND